MAQKGYIEEKVHELKTYYNAIVPEKIEVFGFTITRTHITFGIVTLFLIWLIYASLKRSFKKEVEAWALAIMEIEK